VINIKRLQRTKSSQYLNFDKPLGSSHNDEADLRDVTEEAAKKSQ
jgi:hypothetical protein